MDAEIFDAIKGLVSDRVFPVTFPQEPLPTWPAIRYTPTGGVIDQDACGSGDDETDVPAYQIDVVAKTYDVARTLSNQARDALGAIGGVLDAPPSAVYDSEVKCFRVIMQISFFRSAT